MIMDHYVPCPNDKVAGLHTMMRDFAKQGFGTVLDLGEGICHQLLPEKGYVRPGRLIVGGDSHSDHLRGFQCPRYGVGSSDLAAAIIAGSCGSGFLPPLAYAFRALPPSVSAKDLALWIVGHIGAEGGRYKAIEFYGDGLSGLGGRNG